MDNKMNCLSSHLRKIASQLMMRYDYGKNPHLPQNIEEEEKQIDFISCYPVSGQESSGFLEYIVTVIKDGVTKQYKLDSALVGKLKELMQKSTLYERAMFFFKYLSGNEIKPGNIPIDWKELLRETQRKK